MPLLPSGARIWLSMAAILEPQTKFLPCRSGQFWYRDLDPASSWLPGDPGRPPECLRTATVPSSRLEVASHVQVLIAAADEDQSRWRGDWLLTFDRPSDFSVADWEASLEFFGSERTMDFLDQAIDRVQTRFDAFSRHEGREGVDQINEMFREERRIVVVRAPRNDEFVVRTAKGAPVQGPSRAGSSPQHGPTRERHAAAVVGIHVPGDDVSRGGAGGQTGAVSRPGDRGEMGVDAGELEDGDADAAGVKESAGRRVCRIRIQMSSFFRDAWHLPWLWLLCV